MLPHENLRAPIDHHQLSAMAHKTNALRTALRRREPRCRVCRDDDVRTQVDAMLDWVGVPIMMGPGKCHMVTYADVLRDLEPLNGSRAPKDRVTYTSLLNHAKRHYDLDGLFDYWGNRVGKEFEEIFGYRPRGLTSQGQAGVGAKYDNRGPIQILLETMLNESSMTLDGDWESR